jgi:hypothetical protein
MRTLLMIAGLLSIGLAIFLAWVTHCAWWIKLLMNEQMDTAGEGILAVLGTTFPPIGVIHGFILWFS